MKTFISNHEYLWFRNKFIEFWHPHYRATADRHLKWNHRDVRLFCVNCASPKLLLKLLSCSDRVQWLEQQLRCERAFNEDLKARLHDMEAQNEADASSESKSCDCDAKQINEKSKETAVCRPLCPMVLLSMLLSYGYCLLFHLSWLDSMS